MKIFHVADLHTDSLIFNEVARKATTVDAVVIAGDLLDLFSNNSLNSQARAVQNWLRELPAPTIMASGNHDYWVRAPHLTGDDFAEAGWLHQMRGAGRVIAVDGDVIEFGGVRIVVNGWGQLPNVDVDFDILVTHAPPSGCACALADREFAHDFGDPELWPALDGHFPALILAGHIHHPRRFADCWPPIDPTTTILVPGCDEHNETPAHWLIDTKRRSATHSSGQSISW
jgi:Icc-related predicted phosphoesterase